MFHSIPPDGCERRIWQNASYSAPIYQRVCLTLGSDIFSLLILDNGCKFFFCRIFCKQVMSQNGASKSLSENLLLSVRSVFKALLKFGFALNEWLFLKYWEIHFIKFPPFSWKMKQHFVTKVFVSLVVSAMKQELRQLKDRAKSQN